MALGDIIIYDEQKEQILGVEKTGDTTPIGVSAEILNPKPYKGTFKDVCTKLVYYDTTTAGGLVSKVHGIDASTPWELFLAEITKIRMGEDGCLYGDVEMSQSWNHREGSADWSAPIYFTTRIHIEGQNLKITNPNFDICFDEAVSGKCKVTYSRGNSYNTRGLRSEQEINNAPKILLRCHGYSHESLIKGTEKKLLEMIEHYKNDPNTLLEELESPDPESVQKAKEKLKKIQERQDILNQGIIFLG